MSTPARTASAAEQLAATLPVPGLRVSGQLTDAPAPMAAAVVSASLIGPAAAELVLALADTGFVTEAGGGPAARTTAVLRPALERAAAALGDGVLSELVEGDPAGLLSGGPDGVAVFEISDGAAPFGWFAVRIAEQAGQGEDPGTFADRLGRIQDVEMALTVEIGRTRMSIREALAMEPGKVIELDRSAGAPVDVLLNGRRIALGEIVVVDQDYAVRISRILDTADAQR
ncbi:flagellar motor switch protein FliN [Sinomonas atrocyanea]